jgi:hypothetical protein
MRAHNSTFPMDFVFKDRQYDSPTTLFNEACPAPGISFPTFCSRIRRLVLANHLCDSSVAEALYLSADQCKEKYAVRKTWITVDGQLISLQSYFEQCHSPTKISYRPFWSRVKSLRCREMLDMTALQDALEMPYQTWISSYGGGRKHPFHYDGDEVPEQSGKTFPSIAAFLRVINRYAERQLIWSRLKRGWNLDNALGIPATISSKSLGLVYKLIRISTSEVYVGLTVCGLDQRWAFHVRATRNGSTTKLAQAIREDGTEGFERCVLEHNIQDVETLSARETFWVTELQALGPNGLNTLKPGGTGGASGKKTIVEGVQYRSQNEAARCVSSIRHIPENLARAYIAKNLPIPEYPRTHSKHPEAGSILWRKWLAMLRRHPGDVVESWADSYDTFKAEVKFTDPALHLIRIDNKAPWGPTNFRWLTAQQKIENQHGKSIRCNGVEYPSIKSLALAHGIGESTLKDRIRRQGLSVEDAVAMPLGVTSSKRINK